MQDRPIQYIKSFGFRLFFIQYIILVLNKLHLFNSIRVKLAVKKNKLIVAILDKKYGYICDKEYVASKEKDNDDKIWTLWFQGYDKSPDIVKCCIDSVKKHYKEYSVCVLEKDNLNEYIKLNSLFLDLNQKGIITNTHLSDIIRANLLYKYGGLWIDATIYATSDVNYADYDCFKTIKMPTDLPYSISNGKWSSFYLGGKSQLFYYLMNMFEAYWTNEKVMIDYFLIDYFIKIIYQRNKSVKKDIDSVSENNIQIHELNKILNDTYDKKKVQTIMATNKIHKLSYKNSLSDDKNTVWYKIKTGGKL